MPSRPLLTEPICAPILALLPVRAPRLVPSIFRTAILERQRLPLDVTDATCTCGGRLDSLGRHRGACPQSGRLRTRAIGPERTVARICREAGAVVRTNMKLRDMNIVCPANDDREIEVLQSSVCGTGQWMLHCAVPQLLVVQLAPMLRTWMVQCCFELAETRRPSMPSWSTGAVAISWWWPFRLGRGGVVTDFGHSNFGQK